MDDDDRSAPDHPLNRSVGLDPEEWEAIPPEEREALRQLAWDLYLAARSIGTE